MTAHKPTGTFPHQATPSTIGDFGGALPFPHVAGERVLTWDEPGETEELERRLEGAGMSKDRQGYELVTMEHLDYFERTAKEYQRIRETFTPSLVLRLIATARYWEQRAAECQKEQGPAQQPETE